MGKQLLQERQGQQEMDKDDGTTPPLNSRFHTDPQRRDRRRQMILQQRGMHP